MPENGHKAHISRATWQVSYYLKEAKQIVLLLVFDPVAITLTTCLAIRTIMVAKFKLWKRNSTNSTLTHSIPAVIAMSQYSVYDGWYFGDSFFAELRLYGCLSSDQLAIRSLVHTGTSAVSRRRKTRSFSFWQLKAAFGCPGGVFSANNKRCLSIFLCRRLLD